MTARHQDITFGVTGQSLVWDAPEGRPSSVTSVTVYMATTGDSGSVEGATTGSPAVETNPNTTFDAASGASQSDARLMNLTATTSVTVGRSYLITNAAGEREWPEIIGVVSGASATAREPLANDYAASDTFVGTRISIGVDSTWVADQSNLSDRGGRPGYRVRWVYVVGGVTYVHDSYFSLVRYAGAHTVTPTMVDAMWPGYRDILPTYHQEDEGQRLIGEAFQQVRWDMRASDVDDAALRDADWIDRAVMLRFGVLLAEIGTNAELIEMREKRYREFFDKTFRVTTKVDQSTDTSGAGVAAPALPLWTK